METEAMADNKMAHAPVGSLLFKMSLPLIFSMLFEAFYNVVDSFFLSYVSEDALTAVTLAFPIQLLVVSISVGTTVGVNAVLSRLLGQKNQKGVNSAAVNGVFLAVITYVLFLLFGLFGVKPYFAAQTANSNIQFLGVQYLGICMIFSFGSCGQITYQKLLQSTGRTVLSMISQLTGALFNIIFDPILIFGLCGFPKMGVPGAAVATVVGQAIAFVIAVILNRTKNHEIQMHFHGFRPDGQMIKEIYRVGAPAIVMQALNSVMAFGVNIILIGISTTAVAAFGIYIKVQNFFFMPVFGINNGVIVMTAFNYGARQKKRINQTLKYGMLYAEVILIIGIIVFHVFTRQIYTAFNASPELLAIGIPQLRIISLSYIFVGLTLIWQGFYQGLGNGIYSLIITLMRVVILLLPFLYLFSRITDVNNIWWSFVIAEGGSAIIGAFLLKKIYNEKVAKIQEI